MGIISSLFGRKNKKKNSDKQLSQIIGKDESTKTIPAEYQKTGASYKVYFRNETERKIEIKEKLSLLPNEQAIIEILDTDSIFFDIDVKVYFGEYGLETEDKKSQLAGIGGEYWEKYNVPNDVEYGFVIVNPGEGD